MHNVKQYTSTATSHTHAVKSGFRSMAAEFHKANACSAEIEVFSTLLYLAL